ncbi:hypothetical protein [Mesorhizobium sophorae]|uniref:hypothetical protein n=1 Tax=Mesorhizobium sophorae TaxID=1300294 RepID=UPI000BA434A8|nr:hypothetical protein [Mesorhizobium sophorae]
MAPKGLGSATVRDRYARLRRWPCAAHRSDETVGALLEARSGPKGYDGKSIVCVVPYSREGIINKTSWWHIDSRANNCDKPADTEHRCWCRHGTVGETVHVDKVGNTCGAGAGSIGVPGFHGFLHHGVLRDC